jgi:hypothetical protein
VGGALGLVCVGGRAEPVVSNVTSSQIAGSREVAITYTLADTTALAGLFNVTVQASRDNGATWAPVTQVTGAVSDVAAGSGKQITWNAGAEWPGLLLPQAKVRLSADNGMALIPGVRYIKAIAVWLFVVASVVAQTSPVITSATSASGVVGQVFSYPLAATWRLCFGTLVFEARCSRASAQSARVRARPSRSIALRQYLLPTACTHAPQGQPSSL